MNLFEALDVFSGYITMFSEMGILSDEELTELELAEATLSARQLRRRMTNMKYKMLPVINESDLREALFAQYDVELNIYDYFWLENEYDLLYLDMTSYENCCDDEGYTEMMLILGYLNDIFPQYDAVIICDN